MLEETHRDVKRRIRIGASGVVVGVVLVGLSLLPFMHTPLNGPLVLGDYEVFIVIGLIFFNLGLLVLLQEWFGLT
jgi:hypothetical protein